jgi:DNA-binding NarL/FixJ family response regulator
MMPAPSGSLDVPFRGRSTLALRHELRGRPLSPREFEALRLYAWLGLWKDVASAMGLSLQTVKNHSRTAYLKLDADNATEAFLRLGWLQAPGPKA